MFGYITSDWHVGSSVSENDFAASSPLIQSCNFSAPPPYSFLLNFKSSLSFMLSNALFTHDVHRRSSSPAAGPAEPTGYISFYGYQGLCFCSSATAKSQTPILKFPSTTCSQSSATEEDSYASGSRREACIHGLRSIISSIDWILLSSGYHGRAIPVIRYLQNNCWGHAITLWSLHSTARWTFSAVIECHSFPPLTPKNLYHFS